MMSVMNRVRQYVRRRDKHPAARGFTLLEVITVLIIASLLSVVLMQGLSLVLNLRTNLGDFLSGLDQRILMRSRVIEPLRGIIPDFDDGPNVLKGTPQQISGLTLNPLFARPGRATPFSLVIAPSERGDDVTIRYREGEANEVLIATVQGQQPRFRFMNQGGQWADEWPNPNEPLEIGALGQMRKIVQVPKVILIELNSVSEPDIAVSLLIKAERTPRDLPF